MDTHTTSLFSANFSPKKQQQIHQPQPVIQHQLYQSSTDFSTNQLKSASFSPKNPPVFHGPSDTNLKSASFSAKPPQIPQTPQLTSIRESKREEDLTDDHFDELVNNLTSSMGKERAGYKTSEIVPEMESFQKKVLTLSQEIGYLSNSIENSTRNSNGNHGGVNSSIGIGAGATEYTMVVNPTGDTHHHPIPEYPEFNYIDTGDYYEIVEINPRPQEKWRNEINNDRYSPFIPKIIRKLHAMVPLDEVFFRKEKSICVSVSTSLSI